MVTLALFEPAHPPGADIAGTAAKSIAAETRQTASILDFMTEPSLGCGDRRANL